MKKSIIYWILSFIITLASAYYQRITGPTYPVDIKKEINGREYKFRFHRSHSGTTDQPVTLVIADTTIKATLYWKRYKTNDEWTKVSFSRISDTLLSNLPGQPAAGKLMYNVLISSSGKNIQLMQEPVIIRFKGEVPTTVLIIHVIVIFAAMLLSTRTGFEAFADKPALKKYYIWTIGLLIAGGFILGPIVQKYAFDAYWTGFPFGTDLTDNKVLLALVIWLVAGYAVYSGKNIRFWTVTAAVVMLIIFLIPHSMFGSELDYNKLDKETGKPNIELPAN